MFDKFVAQQLFEMGVHRLQSRNSVHDIACEMESVELVQYRHVERSGGGSFLAIAVHVKVCVICAFVGEAMDQRGITMKRKNHWFVRRENGIEFPIGKSVGMFGGSL